MKIEGSAKEIADLVSMLQGQLTEEKFLPSDSEHFYVGCEPKAMDLT